MRSERPPGRSSDWFSELDESERLLVAIIQRARLDAEAGDAGAIQFLTAFAPELLTPLGHAPLNVKRRRHKNRPA